MIEELLFLFNKSASAHSLLSLGVSFLGGILASLSPCIYPLIPVTLGVIGAYSVSSKTRGFILSFVFVLGLSSIYTVFGIIASVMGKFLGTMLFNPVNYLIVGLFMCVLGLSLLGVIRIPGARFNFSFVRNGNSLLPVFAAGVLSGLTIIPCIFPVLGSILAMISLKKDILFGALNLFSFSLGYGLILMVLGTFGSLISRLPKTGRGLIIVSRCIGLLLITAGIFYLARAVRFFSP